MKIQIEAEDVTGQMFLREGIADGTDSDGNEVEISRIMGGTSLYLKVGKTAYAVDMTDILESLFGTKENDGSN